MVTIADFNQDNFEATDQLRCLKIYIPDGDGYLPLLAGLLGLPGYQSNYQDPDSAQAEGVSAIWRDAYIQTDWEGCGTPPECQNMNSSITIFPDEMKINSGVAWSWTSDTLSSLGGYFLQSPATTTDAFGVARFFAAGAWSYRITYLRNTNAGAMDFEIAPQTGPAIYTTTLDWYGALQRNSVFTGTFTITDPGKYDVNFLGIFNNPASSGDLRGTQRLVFYKTADL